jgi:hypothetical protein
MSVQAGVPRAGMARRTRTVPWMIIAVHVAVLSVPPAFTGFGIGPEPASGQPMIVVSLGLAVLALQLRHSFAIARGRRPRGAWWTMLALAVLVYLPLLWFGWNWGYMQTALIASLPMVLRGWPLSLAIAAPILATVAVRRRGCRLLLHRLPMRSATRFSL